jgi:hypothetical protein
MVRPRRRYQAYFDPHQTISDPNSKTSNHRFGLGPEEFKQDLFSIRSKVR